MDTKWICCPPVRRQDPAEAATGTVLKNYPLFCPKCKREMIVSGNEKGHNRKEIAGRLDAELPLSNGETLPFYFGVIKQWIHAVMKH